MTKEEAKDRVEQARALLLGIPNDYRSNSNLPGYYGRLRDWAMGEFLDICRGCKDDLRRPDGTTYWCHCENDE